MRKITLGQLLREKEKWSLLSQSNTWQYYCDYKNGDWTEVVRIKKSIVEKYLQCKE